MMTCSDDARHMTDESSTWIHRGRKAAHWRPIRTNLQSQLQDNPLQLLFTSAVQPNNITTPSGVTFGKPGPSSLAELLRAIERAKRSVSSSAKAANQLLTSKDVAPSSTSTMNPTATTAFSTLTASASDSPINESFVAVLGLTFDAYVQFMDYTAFARAMQALGGMKLVYAPRMREADTGCV
ncbi:unnamed protein product [Protopolystoma xenopodis]|uniref:Uncharacterized protein n=1 Tax=Protopolystoma xenopodis TaxID=117903 RepID=A0A3S5CKD0_9PLAT|nr:unnamed protein product [Protopolystoma xenopodis]